MRVHLDIETYSSVDLKAAGVYRYVEDPNFQILMCAIRTPDEPTRVLTGSEITQATDYIDGPATLVAHNAQFERICFSRHLGMPTGEYLDPDQWDCTMMRASEHGRPRSLDQLAKALKVAPKDSAGSALIKFFCMPNKQGKRNLPEDHPDKWLEFMLYCAQDVDTLWEIDQALPGWPTAMEQQLWFADQRVNDAGIMIDMELAKAAQASGRENELEQREAITMLTGIDNPGSVPQVRAWLTAEGLSDYFPDLTADTVEAALLMPELTDTQRTVLELRQELALVASKKYTAALTAVCSDERLRGQFNFFGAHTGRWSGRSVQLQNLPRLSFKTEAEADAAILDLKMGLGADAPTLKKLVRPMLMEPEGFTVVDYAAIEARVIAWLAGEQWAIDAFNAGRDIYVETATRMGGLSRPQGKIAVLALGYQGGINSIKAMAGDREALANIASPGTNVDEDKVDVHGILGDPGGYMTDEEIDEGLQVLVDEWRRANKKIVTLWRKLQDNIENGGLVGKHIRIIRSGQSMYIVLPSGRALQYRGVRSGTRLVVDKKASKEASLLAGGPVVIKKKVTGWSYDNPAKPGRIGTYGGRLAENITQAVARDIMAEAIRRLQQAGYIVAMHVHDEIVVRGQHDVDTISSIMCELPDWADGMPIGGEGFTCLRYRKG